MIERATSGAFGIIFVIFMILVPEIMDPAALVILVSCTFPLDILIPLFLALRLFMLLPLITPLPCQELDIPRLVMIWTPQSSKDHLTRQAILLGPGPKEVTPMEALSIPVPLIRMVPGSRPAILRLDLGNPSDKNPESLVVDIQ